jgi:hypothetical protein
LGRKSPLSHAFCTATDIAELFTAAPLTLLGDGVAMMAAGCDKYSS